jgi:hypothetical protein
VPKRVRKFDQSPIKRKLWDWMNLGKPTLISGDLFLIYIDVQRHVFH